MAMKKIIRIASLVIGILLILLITLPILFKSKIESLVKEEINKQVEASVDWSKFSLTFFRGFPDLSVNLHDVSVLGQGVFEGDTLLGLKRFEFRVSPFSAIKKNVIVKSILLDRPLINGIILEDGTANYDIAPEPSETEGSKDGKKKKEEKDKDLKETEEKSESEAQTEEEEKEASTLGLSLKLFAIRDGRISYTDNSANLSASMEDFDLELRGDFAMDETEMNLMMAINGLDARSGGIRYMKKGSFSLDLDAKADMVNSIYTLLNNEIRINGLILGAEGTVEMPEDGSVITDLQFFTRETSFQTLLSLVPAVYLQDFEALETRGSLALDASVTGVLKDSLLPNAILNLKVSDGYFSYPDLPKDVSDVQIDLKVNYDGSNMDATTVKLEQFHLLLGGNPFDINLQADHPFSDLHVAGMVKGMIDFATLKDIVPMEELDLSGRLDADLRWDTKLSYIENEQFEQVDLDGKLLIENVELEAPDIPVPVKLQKLAMYFTPRYVNLETMDLLMGSSDIHLDGRLSNFIPYVFDGQTVSGSLNLSSTLLDANELLPPEDPEEKPESTDAQEKDTSEAMGTGEAVLEDSEGLKEGEGRSDTEIKEADTEIPADSLAQASAFKIPDNIDFAMILDMKKIIYDNIVVENLAGTMDVKEGIANLENLNLDILEGNVALSGTVDTRPEYTEADVELNLIGIDIPASYETFVAIERLAPIAKHCKGKANVEMDMFTKLDAAMNPLYESINADGHLYARNLKVEQPASLEKLSAALKNDKLRNLELEKADIRFAVRDGRVSVQPFDMNFDDSKITASGSHGIDQTMDYLLDMKIAKSDLGAGANELMKSAGALAAGAGFAIPESDHILVKANITGTFKDPRVSTDLTANFTDKKEAVKTMVEEKVKEEVKKVEEEVREEASEKAEELIKEAEAQKEKLISEATAAGEKLKKEAEKQGEKLINEAGNNPIKKIAAQRAAEELQKQAEKQGEKLILEAEEKGDAIIRKAREEAERI